MEPDFQQKILTIKQWLGTGSINIFGLPMSGKDTVGVKLAEFLGGKFLSSGLTIFRQRRTEAVSVSPFLDWSLEGRRRYSYGSCEVCRSRNQSCHNSEHF